MELIYIGDHFYNESSTIMSSIYTVDGERFHWGFVQASLKEGKNINIRQASKIEMDYFDRKLMKLKKFKNRE